MAISRENDTPGDRRTGLAAGTLLRTPFGEAAVETLRVGDIVVSPAGDRHRITGNHIVPPSNDLSPVRVVAGAFGGGAPQRDLVVLAGQHMMVVCVDEILIPIDVFVNESTVARVEVGDDAFHRIELEWPDAIVANGMPVASAVAGEHLAAANDSYSRPVCDDPVIIEALRMRLYTHALSLKWTQTRADPGIALEVDGRVLRPACAGKVARFIVDVPPDEMWIVSRSFVPRESAISIDSRRLGVQVEAVVVDDGLEARGLAFDDPRLTEGFHVPETGFRWTDGRGRLPRELWQGVGAPFFVKLTYETLLPGPLAPPA